MQQFTPPSAGAKWKIAAQNYRTLLPRRRTCFSLVYSNIRKSAD